MKKYILLLGVAAVSIGSYCAYAGNSATMTVTATIAHDVSLSVIQDIDMGTITINPAYDGNDTDWGYDSAGISVASQGALVSAPNVTVGTFTANIPNPEDCNVFNNSCGGLSVTGNDSYDISNFFGGNDESNACSFYIQYSGSRNVFKIFPQNCWISNISSVTAGSHSGTLTIEYNPS
ncbi:MAG: hypothetical protein IJ689_00935 [Alphaproteobacteria bacterium]|nr:hypothetical protein [Alphaproteobacteria bacterium]